MATEVAHDVAAQTGSVVDDLTGMAKQKAELTSLKAEVAALQAQLSQLADSQHALQVEEEEALTLVEQSPERQ